MVGGAWQGPWQGETCMAGSMCGRGHAWQGKGMHGRGRVSMGGGAWQGVHGREACMAGEHAWQKAGEMATAADSTHPTGMHSSLKLTSH